LHIGFMRHIFLLFENLQNKETKAIFAILFPLCQQR